MCKLLLRAERLIDGRGGEPVTGGAVLIEGQRIRAAGPVRGVGAPPGATVCEFPGCTLMPGMIDVHVHLTGTGSPDAGDFWRMELCHTLPELALRGYAAALEALRVGFTTLRDLHSPGGVAIAVKRVIEGGLLKGPRLRVAGQGLCITGGHMDQVAYPSHVRINGRAGVCDSPLEFRRAVREQVKQGADVIKINACSGSTHDWDEPFLQEMSFEEMRAVCEEAHRLHVRVAAHTSGGNGLKEAVLAGVDTVEHGSWLTEEVAALMAQRGTFYVPTLFVNAKNFVYGPERIRVTPEKWGWLEMASAARYPAVRLARQAGVRICTGSDAGFMVVHGENGRELGELVRAGLSPMEAILAATRHGAEALGMGAEVGTLEAGKCADVLVVEGDPLEDVDLLAEPDRIRMVVKGGEVLCDRSGCFAGELVTS